MNLRKGFTLAEILIALGILAIGMSMVAAIFPAAMEFNRRSRNSTLGTIICENGLVLSELALTAEIVASEKLTIYADDPHGEHDDLLPRAQQHYPNGTAKSRTGFVMMARKVVCPVPPNTTYHQVVTVAYRKTDKNNWAVLKKINCRIDGKEIRSANGFLRIGTPVFRVVQVQETIDEVTYTFHRIAYVFVESINRDGTVGTLDIDADNPRQDAMWKALLNSSGDAHVLVEAGELRRSPAIGVLVHTTGLGG